MAYQAGSWFVAAWAPWAEGCVTPWASTAPPAWLFVCTWFAAPVLAAVDRAVFEDPVVDASLVNPS